MTTLMADIKVSADRFLKKARKITTGDFTKCLQHLQQSTKFHNFSLFPTFFCFLFIYLFAHNCMQMESNGER